ncbi:MAG: DUF503 domain-containing protein [Armatimonadetes bacterium]|nr:DUF503 domain-containing protein [Armatimonadota bacterium]
MAYVGIVELTFRLDGCRSLKEKRQVVRSLVDRLRHHFNVSAAEIDHQDQWDLAGIGISVISGDRGVVSRLIEQLIDYAESTTEAELVGIHHEVI